MAASDLLDAYLDHPTPHRHGRHPQEPRMDLDLDLDLLITVAAAAAVGVLANVVAHQLDKRRRRLRYREHARTTRHRRPPGRIGEPGDVGPLFTGHVRIIPGDPDT